MLSAWFIDSHLLTIASHSLLRRNTREGGRKEGLRLGRRRKWWGEAGENTVSSSLPLLTAAPALSLDLPPGPPAAFAASPQALCLATLAVRTSAWIWYGAPHSAHSAAVRSRQTLEFENQVCFIPPGT